MNQYRQEIELVKSRVEKEARILDRLTNQPDSPSLPQRARFQARHARTHLHQAVIELYALEQTLRKE